MANDDVRWGSDVPISIPLSGVRAGVEKVDLGGFAFTPSGLVFDMTEAEHESLKHAPFAPDEVPSG